MNFIKRYVKPIHFVGLAILGALWGLQLWDPVALQTLRLRTFDFYQQLAPREYKPTEVPVVIVDFDDYSLDKYGQWPWPRTLLAELVDKLMNYGVLVIGFDAFFPEYDRISPELVAQSFPELPGNLADQMRRMPPTEMAFAEAMARGRVVLGQGTENAEPGWGDGIPRVANIISKGPDPKLKLPHFAPAVLRNVPELEAAAHGLGMVSIVADADGVFRRVNLAVKVNDEIFPTLDLEMIRVATQGQNYVFKTNNDRTQSVVVRPYDIPTDEEFRAWVHFRNIDPTDGTVYIPAADVLDGVAPADRLKMAFTLVGTSALGLKDIRNTPINPALPGVEVHAQLLEMILNREYLERPPWAKSAEVTVVMIMGLLMIILVPSLGAAYTLLFAIAIIGAIIGSSWYAYTEERMLVDAVYPSLTGLIMYMSLSFMNYMREEAQKKQVRGAFSMYMSPALVEKLADEPDLLKLGGEMKDMSLLFCDIRGFTTISETYKKNPEDLTRFINKFLTPMTGVILDREGTIDKYMGDCIMAFWNAPLDDEQHADHACESALAMIEACNTVNATVKEDAQERAEAAKERLAAAQTRLDAGDVTAKDEFDAAKDQLELAEKEADITVKIGIGINTDVVCVGNMGSDQRFDYSVLGDGVNLASRLEGQSKTYGTTVVLGEKTVEEMNGFATIELDQIRVKGKFEPERIFGLIGNSDLADSEGFQSFMNMHQQMLDAYRSQNWDEAARLSGECRRLCAPYEIEALYDLFDERIAEFKQSPPDPDWDGVYVATSK